jgi:hypothetical protein
MPAMLSFRRGHYDPRMEVLVVVALVLLLAALALGAVKSCRDAARRQPAAILFEQAIVPLAGTPNLFADSPPQRAPAVE